MAQLQMGGDDVDFPHPLEPYTPLIINVALTGVIPTRAMTPHVPLSPEEIVADAVRCHDVGAAVVHIHARDREGQPTYEADVFAEIISGIRKERPQLIVSATTSGRRCGELEHRSAVLELDREAKPDLASLTTGSLNFNDGPSVNPPGIITALAERMLARGIKPELEVLELGMINSAKLLIKKGLVSPPYYFNMLFGSMHTAAATALNLSAAVAGLPRRSVWSATGLGRFQLPVNLLSIAMGGHVRTGVEDNVYYDHARARLASNEQLVRRLVRVAEEAGRTIANAEEARVVLGLPPCTADAGGIRVETARADDVAGMLEVLRTANMHHVPSEEVPELDWRCCFVARAGERVVGMSGYKLLSETEGKTTLMAVDPAYRRYGLGMRLQTARLRAMATLGAQTVVTNADRPVTIAWYKKHFAYRQIGTVPKVHEFGDPDVHEWTTLEMDLEAWTQRERAQAIIPAAASDRQ
jgi:3-keto-5-aminohexanoate cleavage enzyme